MFLEFIVCIFAILCFFLAFWQPALMGCGLYWQHAIVNGEKVSSVYSSSFLCVDRCTIVFLRNAGL